MIEKIKTITYEVRSHGFNTELSHKGTVDWLEFIEKIHLYWEDDKKFTLRRDKAQLKRTIAHLQDVLKCLQRIEKEERDD